MSLSQIESLSVFGLKEDPIASINEDQQVATDQEGKCKGVLHRPCFIPQLAFGAGVAVVCSSCRVVSCRVVLVLVRGANNCQQPRLQTI
jgi:hypothetical protein